MESDWGKHLILMSLLHICIHGWGYHTCLHTLTHIPHAQAHIYPPSTSPIRYLIHESNVKTNQQHSPRQLKQAFPQPGHMTERELKYPPKPRLHASFILTRSRHDWLPICSALLLSRRISRLLKAPFPLEYHMNQSNQFPLQYPWRLFCSHFENVFKH